MNIRICIGRVENAEYFHAQIGDVVEVDFEQYVAAVVASEIGNAAIEACKAQAIAARTYVMQSVRSNKVVSDLSSTAQAYRAKRYDKSLYGRAISGAEGTAGIILTYQDKPINAVYSSNNGGRTVSSQERWGGSARPYLIAQDDPWDQAAGTGKTGHGVGMSQRGAKYAASQGYGYEDILSFYYPNTILQANYGVNKMIQTKDLIALFQKALDEKWGYIWGASGETWTQAKQDAATRDMTVKYGAKWIGKRVSDCSGLFYWAFKQLGGYMYHGSNTMYKQYCTDHGKLVNGKKENGEEIKPGTAVFMWNSTNGWHHVGLFIGNGLVIEAKGTIYGVVSSNVTSWNYWGELKDVDYSNEPSNDEQDDHKGAEIVMEYAKVPGATLNLRKGPAKTEARLLGIPSGSKVQVIEKTNDDWWKVNYNGTTGYVMCMYLTVISSETITLDRSVAQAFYDALGTALA